MKLTMDSPHYVVRVTNLPPTELECRCGMRKEGPDCLDRMSAHIKASTPDEVQP
jgi:hypothetical protein